MIQVLSDPRYGSNLSQVDATVKKHEAISVDIMARVSFTFLFLNFHLVVNSYFFMNRKKDSTI